MFENLDKIKSVITNIFTQISLNKLSICHDLNVLAENVFMYVLNDCFDYHLQNANILNNVPNQVGFDLIYNPQNEMLPFHKTKCSETQNEASSL